MLLSYHHPRSFVVGERKMKVFLDKKAQKQKEDIEKHLAGNKSESDESESESESESSESDEESETESGSHSESE